MTRILTFLLLCLTAVAGPAALPSRPVHVLTVENSLHEKLALGGSRTVKLGRSIKLTKPLLTIPAGVEFVPGQFLLEKGNEGVRIQLDGECVGGRQPCFKGFSPGDIRGTFGGNPVFPEKWQHDPRRADIAINCAVQASPRFYGSTGNIVSLGARRYLVARDIPLGGSAVDLQGAGMGRTELRATSEWVADWQHASEWPAQPDGNHGAMVWIGGNVPAVSTFNTGVRGISINCHDASFAHPEKWISGVSCKAWAEEGTVLDHVSVYAYSGCGVGFPAHNGGVAIINGLKATNLRLSSPTRRDAKALLFTGHAVNWEVDTFTIDSTLYKQNSADYAAAGQSDPAVYPKPVHILEQQLVAAKIAGIGKLSTGHIEGPQVCVWVAEGNAANSIILENLKFWYLADRNQVWPGDGRGRTTAAPDDADQWDFSTGVLLSSTDWDLTRNIKDSLHARNLVSKGQCNILLSDFANDLRVSAFGQGQFPKNPTGKVTEYVRGPAYQPGNYRLIR